MIMKKETLVFLTSLAIIFIIGYVNMTMAPKNKLDEAEYSQTLEANEQAKEEDVAVTVDDENVKEETSEVPGSIELVEDSSETEVAVADEESDESIYEILGDITDITDIANITDEPSSGEVAGVSGESNDLLNVSFANFKLNKEKDNMEVVDALETNLSNSLISEETKKQFEALLLNKNEFIQTELDIELLLQAKGYNESLVVVDDNMVKVITNDKIEQADATKILNIVVTETNFEPSQIKIVKFDNIDL